MRLILMITLKTIEHLLELLEIIFGYGLKIITAKHFHVALQHNITFLI